MKANELRIGNWVQPIGECIQITGVDTIEGVDYIKIWGQYHHIKGIEPIPITEEWLIKLGFNDDGFKQHEFLNWGMKITYDYNPSHDWWIVSQGFVGFAHLTNVQYIHELQNLYFALTGEEL